MEVSGQLHDPAVETAPPVTILYEALRAPEPVWTLWRREKPLPGMEPLLLSRPSRNLVVMKSKMRIFIKIYLVQ
jgi:hypothetical protein